MPAPKRDPAPLSPERQALADAIEDLRQFDAGLDSLRQHEEASTDHLYATDTGVDAAEAALKAAIAEQERYRAVSRPTFWEPAPAPPLELVEAVPAARARYDEARSSRDAIRRDLRKMEAERDRRADDLRRSALAVIAAHAAAIGLPAEVDRLQCAALDAGMRLQWLAQEGGISIERTGFEPSPVEMTLTRMRSASTWGLPPVPGARPWVAALQTLMTDATAEIP
jgi:hypothetical protein